MVYRVGDNMGIKPRPDLLCLSCGEVEATHLLFYIRYYPEISLPSWVDPSIVCQACKDRIETNQQYDTRQVEFHSFREISEMPDKARGYLMSRKGKEFNALSSKFWRKKIWRLKHAGTEKLSECLQRLRLRDHGRTD